MVTLIGVFAAISTILMYIELPIPFMPPFLKIDLSGAPHQEKTLLDRCLPLPRPGEQGRLQDCPG